MTALAQRWGYATMPGFDGWEPAKVADALAGLGYRYIEWTPDFCGGENASAATVATLAQASEQAGLRISQIMAMADYVTGSDAQRRARIEMSRRIVDAAAENGIAMVGVYAGPDTWDAAAPALFADIGADEAWGRVFDALDTLIEHAAQRNVTLSFKPCVGTVAFDFYSALPVLARYGDQPGFAVNFDPSHFALAGNDVGWAIRQLGPVICHVQLKDVFGIPGVEERHFHFPLIGDGIVDWRAFLGALSEIGYDGPLIALYEMFALHRALLNGDPVAAARMTMDRLRLLEPTASPEGGQR